MIRYTSTSQLSFEGFAPFCDSLDSNNRWIILGSAIPWDDLAKIYYRSMSGDKGRPCMDARAAIGALIIKHRIGLDDRGTVAAIQENPYMQWFCGLSAFTHDPIFDPSLLVSLRKRMGVDQYDQMTCSILEHIEQSSSTSSDQEDEAPRSDHDADHLDADQDTADLEGDSGLSTAEAEQDTSTNRGELLMDATVAPQDIAYPTDLKLLDKGRMRLEEIIDKLCDRLKCPRPRTYRRKARKQFLEVARKKRSPKKVIRRGIKRQLNFIRRDLKHIHGLLDRCGMKWPLTKGYQRDLWVITLLHEQQRYMYDEKVHSVADRLVSIHEPWVRPIVRGKARARTEFGAKICVSLCEGISRLDHLGWDAYNESSTLQEQVERYQRVHGHYPQSVNADGIYGTRQNRKWLKERDIEFIGKALGRPNKESRTAKAKRELKAKMVARNAIEGKFGQAKVAYGMDLVRARLKDTSESWIAASVFITNLIHWEKILIDRLCSHGLFAGISQLISYLTSYEVRFLRLAVAPMRQKKYR